MYSLNCRYVKSYQWHPKVVNVANLFMLNEYECAMGINEFEWMWMNVVRILCYVFHFPFYLFSYRNLGHCMSEFIMLEINTSRQYSYLKVFFIPKIVHFEWSRRNFNPSVILKFILVLNKTWYTYIGTKILYIKKGAVYLITPNAQMHLQMIVLPPYLLVRMIESKMHPVSWMQHFCASLPTKQNIISECPWNTS